MSDSSSFLQLDERIQRYLWTEGWDALRAVQELATPLILPGDADVLLAANTAEGKTEAAFLPALTHLLRLPEPGLIVYVSPLKALINDQFARLERLCETLDIPVWPWHGDVGAGVKRKFRQTPQGVLLITPESLEAMLCRGGSAVPTWFARLAYIVVDELHAFIGSERGKQLQSQLHRIEQAIGRTVPRIGLSATLGDLTLAGEFLRAGGDVRIVDAGAHGSVLKVLVKGFEEPKPDPQKPDGNDVCAGLADVAVAHDLFGALRDSNNLVFPNSRAQVERYTMLLNQLCEEQRLPRRFWPHHGSLSKELREETEAAVKQKQVPASAVCTNTLELGIDIGAVKSVAQIGPPHSVASLRQRLGRSGRRRGEAAILRGYVIEDALDAHSDLRDRLRLRTVQMVAMISLLLDGWCEPPATHGKHLSTLVQQLLSALAEHSGLQARAAYELLCGSEGAFAGLSSTDFAELLRHLGTIEMLMQDSSGLLLPGRVGEAQLNHYSFYAAFATPEEYRLLAGGRMLGTLPVDTMLRPNERIVFAGRAWKIDVIDDAHKTILLTGVAGSGQLLFAGGGGHVHGKVRSRMRELLGSKDTLRYLDPTAQRFLDEGRVTYTQLQLDRRIVLSDRDGWLILTWLGDTANAAIACWLACLHPSIQAQPGTLGVFCSSNELSLSALLALARAVAEPPPIAELLRDAHALRLAKWDWALPEDLLRMAYASLFLDMREARGWLNRLPVDVSHLSDRSR